MRLRLAHTVSAMNFPRRRLQRGLLALGLAWAGIGGPVLLVTGVRLIGSESTSNTVGGWLMAGGGVLMLLGGGLTLHGLLRRVTQPPA